MKQQKTKKKRDKKRKLRLNRLKHHKMEFENLHKKGIIIFERSKKVKVKMR